jgi:peptidoglycan/xylan/chitin deacetylase (PgdA/CDA1 family)
MNVLAKSTFCALYKYSGVMHAQERLAYWSGRRFMSIVLFHRVTDEVPEDGLTVSTAWFRGFCAMMRDRFHVVSLAELHRLLSSGATPPRRTVAITFDDCYRDNLAAGQVLADHHLPATFFLPTRFVETDYVFPWDRHLKPMPNLGWKDVRALVDLGHEIGSHTMTHPDLGQIGPEDARTELADSKKTLEDRLQRPVRWFAYPYGGRGNFRPAYLQLASEIGYDACFSGHGGFVQPHMLGQVLPRENLTFFRSLMNLELHLTGCLDWLYQLKRSVGIV